MRPIIGVGAYPRIVDIAFGPTLLQTVTRFYIRAVERAGGLAIVFPVTEPERVPELVRLAHGVLLTGGGDVQPSLYGAPPSDATREVDPERDAFEMALVDHSVSGGIPLLGICRGMQLMNVALGGTLTQDVFAVTGEYHHERQRFRETIHGVKIEPGSHLANALGVTSVPVNSVHRQGMGELAQAVRPTGWADDGSVEAIELDSPDFGLGVQWHPEVLEDQPEHRGLFNYFVEQARAFALRR